MTNTLIGMVALAFAWLIYHELSLLVKLIRALHADVRMLVPSSSQDETDDELDVAFQVPLFGAPRNMGELRAAYRAAKTPRVWRVQNGQEQ